MVTIGYLRCVDVIVRRLPLGLLCLRYILIRHARQVCLRVPPGWHEVIRRWFWGFFHVLRGEQVNATSVQHMARYTRLVQALEMLERSEEKFVNADIDYTDGREGWDRVVPKPAGSVVSPSDTLTVA